MFDERTPLRKTDFARNPKTSRRDVSYPSRAGRTDIGRAGFEPERVCKRPVTREVRSSDDAAFSRRVGSNGNAHPVTATVTLDRIFSPRITATADPPPPGTFINGNGPKRRRASPSPDLVTGLVTGYSEAGRVNDFFHIS